MINLKLSANCRNAMWLIAIVIGFYYAIVVLFSRNFPISDDYVLLEFLTKTATTSDLMKILGLLFAQHNEHRIITTKLFFLLDYWIFSELNFRRLILIGNLFHLGTFYILMKNIPKINGYRCFFAIFAACMIFQFGSAESMLWAMAAISNYLVLMLVLLTLHLFSRGGASNYMLAVIAALLAVFSQGNGMLILFIGIAYLLSQKRFRESLILVVITLIVLLVYFINYQVPEVHSDPMNALHNLGKIIIFALSFTGSAFGVGGSHYLVLTNLSLFPTLTFGSLVWIFTGYSFYKKSYTDGNIFIWFNVFIILTAILTATTRINFGLSQSMVIRYHVNSNLVLISTAALGLQTLPIMQIGKRALDRVFNMSVIASVVYLVATFALALYFYLIVFSPLDSQGIIYPDNDYAAMVLETAQKLNVFDIH